MLDKILKLDFSVFLPLAVIITEYNSSGRITFLVRCPGPRQITKDSPSSLVPVFVIKSTTRTVKIVQMDMETTLAHKLYLNSIDSPSYA